MVAKLLKIANSRIAYKIKNTIEGILNVEPQKTNAETVAFFSCSARHALRNIWRKQAELCHEMQRTYAGCKEQWRQYRLPQTHSKHRPRIREYDRHHEDA
jgi:hypothetical protein